MAQWVNCLRNNIFVNPLPLPLLCEISGALHLVQPGLTVSRQAGRQSDEMQVNFKIFKVGCRSKFSTCLFVYQWYCIITALSMHSSWLCQVKSVARLILKCDFSGSHMISYQSLKLSNIVLNDRLDLVNSEFEWYSCEYRGKCFE